MRDINAAAAMSRCSPFDDTTILAATASGGNAIGEMDTLNHNDNTNQSNSNCNNLTNANENNVKNDVNDDSNNQETFEQEKQNNNNINNNNNISTLQRNDNNNTETTRTSGGQQYSAFRTNTMAHVCWHRSCSIGRDEYEVAFGVSKISHTPCP